VDAIRVLTSPQWSNSIASTQRAASCCNDEAQLIARCRARERAAFEQLLNRYRERVVNLAYSLLGSRDDAEDAAQEAFVKAFSSLNQFRGDAKFWTWLYRITVNVCHARGRRASHGAINDCEYDLQHFSSQEHNQTTTATEVQQALLQISPTLRSVLVLREMHGLSYEEIAQVLEIPIGTVRSRLNEARSKFRAIWQEDET
jgi:RNA polymerase sigma-70 factor, ECF subfamily